MFLSAVEYVIFWVLSSLTGRRHWHSSEIIAGYLCSWGPEAVYALSAFDATSEILRRKIQLRVSASSTKVGWYSYGRIVSRLRKWHYKLQHPQNQWLNPIETVAAQIITLNLHNLQLKLIVNFGTFWLLITTSLFRSATAWYPATIDDLCQRVLWVGQIQGKVGHGTNPTTSFWKFEKKGETRPLTHRLLRRLRSLRRTHQWSAPAPHGYFPGYPSRARVPTLNGSHARIFEVE